MKKILITAFSLSLAVPALAAQQDIAQISAVTASREALRTAVNTQLSAVQANFDEIYTAVGTRPWVIQATAPADTTLAWFDTAQVVDAVVLKIHNGERWVPQAIGEGGSYTLPTAAADTLGGVKVGDRLSIADGVLSADIQTTDISGKENSLGNPSVTGYVLSSTTAGVRSWIEMTGGGTGIAHAPSDGNYYASKDGVWATLAGVFQPADADLTSAAGGSAAGNSKLFGTNSSGVVGWYDIPGEGSGIAHATADGKWYGSKDGAWVDLAPTFSSALPKWIDMSVGYTFTAGDLTWYNGQVWKASGTHSKVLGEYPDAESTDWEDYIQAPIVVDYPTEVGVPAWTAEGWSETSYTVGTAANNLVQLNGSAQLPAVSGALLTGSFTGTLIGSQTTLSGAIQTIGTDLDRQYELLFGAEFTETDDTEDKTTTVTLDYPVTSETYGSSWSADTEGTMRKDIYAILHVGDTDDDGMADKLDLASAGFVKVNSSGVISSVKEKEYIGWSVVNSDTATAVADGKLGAAVPAGMNEMNLTDVTCSVAALNAAASGATTAVIRRVRLGSRMGDNTSQFDLTFSTPNVTITWDSTGTDPGISTSTLAAGDEVDISGFETAANNGHFTVATVGANYFTFANASGVENLDDVGVTITPIRHRDMTSTGVTISYNEYTASDETVDTSNDDLATGDKLYVDINAVTTPAQKGLHCTTIFEAP